MLDIMFHLCLCLGVFFFQSCSESWCWLSLSCYSGSAYWFQIFSGASEKECSKDFCRWSNKRRWGFNNCNNMQRTVLWETLVTWLRYRRMILSTGRGAMANIFYFCRKRELSDPSPTRFNTIKKINQVLSSFLFYQEEFIVKE